MSLEELALLLVALSERIYTPHEVTCCTPLAYQKYPKPPGPPTPAGHPISLHLGLPKHDADAGPQRRSSSRDTVLSRSLLGGGRWVVGTWSTPTAHSKIPPLRSHSSLLQPSLAGWAWSNKGETGSFSKSCTTGHRSLGMCHLMCCVFSTN